MTSRQPNEPPQLLHRSRLRGAESGRIRKLPGFLRHHRLPDLRNDASRAFVRRVGHPRVEALAENLHRDLRRLFHFTRRDMEYTCEDGAAFLKTPSFDLQIRADHCPEDLKNFRIETEIPALRDPDLPSDERFHTCFEAHCDELVVAFSEAVCVEDKIDALESIPSLAECLDYKPDGSWCELRLESLDLHIAFTAEAMTFRLLGRRDLGRLIRHAGRAFAILTETGLYPRLDGVRGH